MCNQFWPVAFLFCLGNSRECRVHHSGVWNIFSCNYYLITANGILFFIPFQAIWGCFVRVKWKAEQQGRIEVFLLWDMQSSKEEQGRVLDTPLGFGKLLEFWVLRISLSVLTDSAFQESTALDLRPWKKLSKLINSTEITSVELIRSVSYHKVENSEFGVVEYSNTHEAR